MVRQTLKRITTQIRVLPTVAYERITAPVQGLHQAAYVLAALTLASQALALLRDRTFAHTFGAGQTLDIYYAAFRIPDFIFVTVASVVSISVLVPFIMEEESRGRENLRHFINNIFSFFSFNISINSSYS